MANSINKRIERLEGGNRFEPSLPDILYQINREEAGEPHDEAFWNAVTQSELGRELAELGRDDNAEESTGNVDPASRDEY